MYEFHATIHARPENASHGEPVQLGQRQVRPLALDPKSLSTGQFAHSFERAIAALGELERMYCEPDGSFVWTSGQGSPRWQLDGNLYDRQERVLFVDVKGTCPREEFDRLLAALGWPETPLVFQLTREAVFLDEAEFRRFAAAD
jgi:hypothetical protein